MQNERVLIEWWAAKSYKPFINLSTKTKAVVAIDTSQLKSPSTIKVYISKEFEVPVHAKGCLINTAQNRAVSVEGTDYDCLVTFEGDRSYAPIRLQVIVNDTDESYYKVHPYWLP